MAHTLRNVRREVRPLICLCFLPRVQEFLNFVWVDALSGVVNSSRKNLISGTIAAFAWSSRLADLYTICGHPITG
jgi:hypothetical protein